MKNLTKSGVQRASTMQLIIRFDRLMELGETAPAGVISLADARETVWIEEQLHERLIKAVGHDFYPPDRIEETPPSGSIKSVLERVKSEMKSNDKIKFRVTVTSSIGSKAAEFSVEGNSKSDGDKEAQKMIRKLGITGATYKLS